MAGTPWYSYCNKDYSDNFCGAELDFTHGTVWDNPNWCQIPWCYVDKDCATGIASSVFSGSPAADHDRRHVLHADVAALSARADGASERRADHPSRCGRRKEQPAGHEHLRLTPGARSAVLAASL